MSLTEEAAFEKLEDNTMHNDSTPAATDEDKSKYSELADESLKEVAIEEESEPGAEQSITTPFKPSDIRLSNPPMNLGDLIDMMREDWIKFDPDYQRAQNLWDPRKQSRLIESVLLGLRLPAFYFEEINAQKWIIIDGLQRCCAIRNFCVEENMTLSDLEFLGERYENKRFSEMDFATRRSIRMLPITVNLVAAGVPPAVKYILFKRLNTGGLPLTDQEVRNAVYAGSVISAIADMAHSAEFQEATQYKVESKRKTDMDFVSRFVAFYHLGWKNYRPSLDDYINRALEDLNKNPQPDTIEKMKDDFKSAMTLAWRIFGNRAFRKQQSLYDRRRPLNKAYFEVISVCFAGLTESQRSVLCDRGQLLNNNLCTAMRESEQFRYSFSGGTGTSSAVNTRFSWVEKIIEATLDNKQITITNDNPLTTPQLQISL